MHTEHVLPATKTHPTPGDRIALFWGLPDRTGGVLTISQGKDDETYTIGEECNDGACRVWMVNRESGPITAERLGTYEVRRHPGGWDCNCTGFACSAAREQKAATKERRVCRSVGCKHTQSLAALVAAGELVAADERALQVA